MDRDTTGQWRHTVPPNAFGIATTFVRDSWYVYEIFSTQTCSIQTRDAQNTEWDAVASTLRGVGSCRERSAIALSGLCHRARSRAPRCEIRPAAALTLRQPDRRLSRRCGTVLAVNRSNTPSPLLAPTRGRPARRTEGQSQGSIQARMSNRWVQKQTHQQNGWPSALFTSNATAVRCARARTLSALPTHSPLHAARGHTLGSCTSEMTASRTAAQSMPPVSDKHQWDQRRFESQYESASR